MEKKTFTGELTPKENHVIWYKPEKKRFGENLMKNMGVAAALVLCAVTLRSGAIPGATDAADAVLAAVTDDTLLDDKLGKLSFVSKMFPEATLVFGQSGNSGLSMPVNGGAVIHAWSRKEPYMSWRTDSEQVYSAGEGIVMGVYHGPEEERIVEVMGKDGLRCLYGNLKSASVQPGDTVSAGTKLGLLLKDRDCVFEIRKEGVSVDPAVYLANVQ